ncbi:NAD-dependent epimerase/dehydratase family protein [Streptomyces sp. DSM 44917]|uniref:NAD-dependent epimerase/dehydratase family protein n=1 Tax=Streptomyces boetiae TaxID=3075541 RepID=A0ABU2L4G6_9ACTN|nr:NAD-dependent epimerase/dehydratase family protein [Streptomyces sp. DSM 44917]MDT0306454.1 NAD-dependent epimerase/dehydratase family protein [Streptomyces sp. DSM 44917]
MTGATGYIGGTVVVRLLKEGHAVAGLTRGGPKAEALAALGAEPVLGTLDDAELLTERARAADAVINAADSDHRGAVEALIAGLAGSGKPFVHTSGSSIVSDGAGGRATEAVFTDADVTPGSAWTPLPDKAERVAVDRLALGAAESGVRAAVLCPTLIYGHGRGPSRDSIQIPALVRQARADGVVRHAGPGQNVWSHAHVDDLAELYLLALERALPGAFFFVENGEESFGALTAALAKALGLPGPEPWGIEEAVAAWGSGMALHGLASNCRVRGSAREALGWSPRHASVTDWIAEQGPAVA